MLDPAIQEFLAERKEGWLKKKIKPSLSEAEQAEFEQEANQLFSLAEWLPNAAKRAKQLNLVSHPSKFSHPGAKTSSVIAQARPENDGFLRFGNVEKVEMDVLGNAAAIDVYKFLSLKLQDDQTVLEHLEQQSKTIQQQFAISSESFESLHQGFMEIKSDGFSRVSTSGSVKQVYFPVEEEENGYHLLSILTSSGMMYELKKRINYIRFSDAAKQAREDRKGGEYNVDGVREIYDLTAIGFGGTKPQNISILNNANGGVAYLLKSVPPDLSRRNVRLPKKDFFNQTLWTKEFEWIFSALNSVLIEDARNNIDIRLKRDELFAHAVENTSRILWKVRTIEAGWSNSDTYDSLPQWQKHWLDAAYECKRAENDDYIDQAVTAFSRWFITAFEAYLKVEKVMFDDVDIRHFIGQADLFDSAMQLQIKEAFR
ncbi:type I-F CRISPR-associated protein Csy1 [Thiomicrorhabdus xiamenensis]|uniref:Type I-F CRISPR-associated protein Csy1 n=1 Tax=Thiomicrorhabdus xiamenensis TaxID=2739063 RepID=A0A7D4NJE6_9GAMM|nr:type I-F CRISPR-associated protein Csy1 [Thiomicrorhabdus xiamenensis]QKI88149.1 type I-F CRISPR-associated protein Csy1 [Thiomicrorhabdus xiamenensis]